MDILTIAKEAITIEIESLKGLLGQLDHNFESAAHAILNCKGKLIVSGMGKSGHIGAKMAATFASTGTPSFFLHPAEAYHGDLGMIAPQDVVMLISYSGETDEVLKLIPFLHAQKNYVIGMSGNPESSLSKHADSHLNINISREACPLELAPTTSTTATLVVGDALAVALIKMRNFQKENFAKFHPGGTLGVRLLARVSDYMQIDHIPFVNLDTEMEEVVDKINTGRLGLTVVGAQHQVQGIITDGDLRRAMKKYKDTFFEIKAKDIMTATPLFIEKSAKLLEAQKLMTERKVASLLVGKPNHLLGVIQMYHIKV